MKRGEVWLAEIGRKQRPVLVLTRDGVLDVRSHVTIAELTTSIRGHAAEVTIDAVDMDSAGLDKVSAINCDGLHTVAQSMLTMRLGELRSEKMRQVCTAVANALDCRAY